MVTQDKTQADQNKTPSGQNKTSSKSDPEMEALVNSILTRPRAGSTSAVSKEPASAVSKETSPKPAEAPKAFSQEDIDKAVQTALMNAGRDWKALEVDRDTLKIQLAAKDTEIKANAAEIEKLQAKFDDLAKDDPEKFDVAKELKAARAERNQLRDDRVALDEEKRVHSESIKLATETLREIAIFDIANEYEGGDPVKLKGLCETFKVGSEEQYRKVADALWVKKSEVSKSPAEVASAAKIPAELSLKIDTAKISGGVIGRKPTLEEVRAATPKEFDDKVKSGEWKPF